MLSLFTKIADLGNSPELSSYLAGNLPFANELLNFSFKNMKTFIK